MPAKRNKLFVWTEVLYDYTPGMIVVLAPDMETALRLGRECCECHPREMGQAEPLVIDDPAGADAAIWSVHGGG